MNRDGSGGRLVYSSDKGAICPKCGWPKDRCRCAGAQPKGRSGGRKSDSPAAAAPADGIVRVARETKQRRGKGVTIVTGVPLAGAELKALAKTLKKTCGSGGTIRDGAIEIQGDHRDRLVEKLESLGYRVKRAGG